MTPIFLLEALKKRVEEATKDLVLPSRNPETRKIEYRVPGVYIGQLPDVEAETALSPYILLRFITGEDKQEEGEEQESGCNVRIIVTTYNENGEEKYMSTLNIVTRIRMNLLENRVVGEQFILKMPLDYIVYEDDNTEPYGIGELMTLWNIPTIEQIHNFDESFRETAWEMPYP